MNQIPQLFLIGKAFQSSDHLHGPPLEPLQQPISFLALGTADLGIVLQMGPYKGRVEGDNYFPSPVGQVCFYSVQDAVELQVHSLGSC